MLGPFNLWKGGGGMSEKLGDWSFSERRRSDCNSFINAFIIKTKSFGGTVYATSHSQLSKDVGPGKGRDLIIYY